MKLKGSVALVTGANRGLGKAFIEALLESGASRVYAAARSVSEGMRDPRIIPLVLDVRSPNDIAAAAARCADVDLLINNAGVAHPLGVLDPRNQSAALVEWETNVMGPLRLAQSFAPILKSNGGGALLNVLSALTWISIPGAYATYAASKSALWSLTNSLRLDLGPQGTQVSALHVGFMDTDMAQGLQAPKADPAQVARLALEQVEAGAVEILADPVSRQLQQHLASGVYLQAPRLG